MRQPAAPDIPLYPENSGGRTKLTPDTASHFCPPLGPLNQNGNQLHTDPNRLHAVQLERRAGKIESSGTHAERQTPLAK